MSTGSLFMNSAAPAAPIPGSPSPTKIPLMQILQQGREVDISPSLAMRILSECRCEHHSAPTRWKVEYLADEIKAGKLRVAPQSAHLWFALLDERLILLKGWARLAAVQHSRIAVRFLIGVTPIQTPEQLRALALGGHAKRKVIAAARLKSASMESGAPAIQKSIPELHVPAPENTPALAEILIHGREVCITPTLAVRIEKECRYEYERPLKQWRLDFLVSEIERGGFEQGRQISFALVNGKLIRVNGQHRLNAVATTGEAQVFMVEVKPVASASELAALYATYDNESRTLSETAGPLARKGDLRKEEVATLLRSVQFIYSGFRKPDERQAATMRSHVMRNSVAEIWYPYAERYFALTEQAPGKDSKAALRRQSVAAVALYTLKFQPEKAAEFWQGLAMDDGLRRTDPRKSLLEKLRSGDCARSIVFQMHAVAAAWNAFFANRKMKEVRVRLDKPFRIAGTPVSVERLDEELANA
jgi:hypothetical protein